MPKRRSAFNAGFSKAFGHPLSKGHVKICCRPHPKYMVGDIIAAVPWRQIRHDYTQRAIFKKDNARGRRPQRLNLAGVYDKGDPAEDFCRVTMDRKLVRTGQHTCKLVRLSDNLEIEYQTGQRDVFDWDGNHVWMDVDRYFGDRHKTLTKGTAQGRPLFGSNMFDLEIYGGHKDYSDDALDAIWEMVEDKLQETEVSYATTETAWNLQEHRKHLILCVNNFTDEEGALLSSSVIEEIDNPVDPQGPPITQTVHVRRNKIEFVGLKQVRGILAQVADRHTPVVIEHDMTHIRQLIVESKV